MCSLQTSPAHACCALSAVRRWMWSWTIQFLTATDYPSIVSLSYGLPELDQCTAFYKSDCYGVDYRTYINLVDKQFMKVRRHAARLP